jgi:UPF0271 protein
MRVIDLNCDMGEGMDTDAAIMPFLSSANIACGFHAGDANTMLETLSLAKQFGVVVGAHVSFRDRENFGRSEMNLFSHEVYQLVQEQLTILDNIAGGIGIRLHHVKPHGALYNMSARDPLLATIIAGAIRDYDPNLVLYGLSGSCSITEAKRLGIRTANEVFADRTYRDDGSLTPRSQAHALIDDEKQVVSQVFQMIREGRVTTTSGKSIPIVADTICLHGDGLHAVSFAKHIHESLKENRIGIQAI